MYKGYFGLKESPFSIAPNPRFLFMSERHKEALVHLSYGLGETGGFALLTGEVGTGKTTISRRLMEQLPETTQAACILNPTLSSQELLATICDELKVRYRKTGATLKTLSDKIHEKLNKNHSAGINTLLIIDEAQHLAPEVLEQLRLLTNLETDTKKLLQVILIGQPELKQLLQRRDLRQLAQRITARYHLMPLTKDEVGQYIKHRLSVAECDRMLFESSAVAEVHRISQGIPRIINLLCERSLTNAYCSNNALVNKKIVLKSAQEALGDEYQTQVWWQHIAVKAVGVSALLGIMVIGSYYLGQQYGQSITDDKTVKLVKEPAIEISEKLNEFESIKEAVDPSEQVKNTTEKLNSSEKPKEFTIKSDGDEKRAVEIATEKSAAKIILPAPAPAPEAKQDTPIKLEPAQQQKSEVAAKEKFSVSPAEGVSDDLLARFQSAMDEADDKDGATQEQKAVEENVPTLSDMPNWVQNGVPSLTFDLHIYASEGDSWVKVNGRDRYEGDKIAEDLILNTIYAQKVILTFKGEKFSLPALSTW